MLSNYNVAKIPSHFIIYSQTYGLVQFICMKDLISSVRLKYQDSGVPVLLDISAVV